MTYSEHIQYDRYLSPGEYILWQGKPASKRPFTGGDVFLIIFTLFWCGICFRLEYSAIKAGQIQLILFGLPFVAMGCYLLFGRFIHEHMRRKHTSYIITNKKIISIYKGRTNMISLNNLPPIQTQIYKNGNSNIRFNMGSYRRRGGNTRIVWFTLENIPDCAKVEQIIFDNMENR